MEVSLLVVMCLHLERKWNHHYSEEEVRDLESSPAASISIAERDLERRDGTVKADTTATSFRMLQSNAEGLV